MGRGEVTEASDPDRFREVVRRTADALDGWGRSYALLGSIATNVYVDGEPADDVDVFVEADHVEEALGMLVAAGFEAEPVEEGWLRKATRDGVLVDLIVRVRSGIRFDEDMVSHVRRRSCGGVDVPVLAPEDLVLIAAASTHPETPQHWFVGARLVAKAGLDWDRLVDRARRLAPLRVASLLLYCRSEGVAVPEGAVASLLSN